MATPTLNLELVINARRMKQGADEAKRAAREVGKEAKDAAVQVDRLEAEVNQTGAAAGKAAPQVRKVGEEVKAAGTKARVAKKDLDQAKAGLSGLGGAASMAVRTMQRLGIALTAYAVARRTIGTVAGFGESIAQLQAITGASGETLESLSNAARQAGATTRYTAGEAAQGLLELSKAGLTAEQSIKGLTPALNLATFAAVGLGESAEMLVNVAAQFGLEAKSFERIGDVLVKAANVSTSDVTDLAQGLKDVGVVGKQVGLSLEDTVAALGLLGQRGLKGSDGAIKLRQAFLQLLDPSAEAQITLDRMGLSLDDVDIRSRGLVPVLKTLRDAQLDIVEASQLVGARNAAALIELAQGVEEYEKMRGALDGVTGSMAKAAAILNDTLIGKWREFNSAIDETILKAGDVGLGAVLKGAVGLMTDFVRVANDAVVALQLMGEALDGSVGERFAKIFGAGRPPSSRVVTGPERGPLPPSFSEPLVRTPVDPDAPNTWRTAMDRGAAQLRALSEINRAEALRRQLTGLPLGPFYTGDPHARRGIAPLDPFREQGPIYPGGPGGGLPGFDLQGPPGDTPFRAPGREPDARAQEADASIRMLSGTLGDLASSALFASGNIRELMSSLLRSAGQNFARTAFTTAFESVLGGTAGQGKDAAANAANGVRTGAGGF